MKTQLISKIHQTFTPEQLVELCAITYQPATNYEKVIMIENVLENKFHIPFLKLGSGTNRYGVQIGDMVFKIALDEHGKIDNMREYTYTDKLQPYVIKCYECTPDGLVMVCEPFSPISEKEFLSLKNEIIPILKELSKNFFIGDIGFTTKNNANWGRRKSDGQLGILDFAYCYSTSYKTFCCTCASEPFLQYDENFNDLICPICQKKWSFRDVRKRISRKNQLEEIGDIRKLGYNLTSEFEIVEKHSEYTISLYAEEEKKKEKRNERKERKRRNREILRRMNSKEKSRYDEYDIDSPTTFDELIAKMKKRIADNKAKEEKSALLSSRVS